ncbi:MAG TPA: glycoside hydrolase family 2 TIM barrel-domain containing protein, partial [Chloroflexota bacterium]
MLVAPGVPTVPSASGRLRVALLRLVARFDDEPAVRLTFAILGLGAAAVVWALTALVHELLVLAAAALLPVVAAFEPIQWLLALLPINYVYAAATVRYAGQIEPAGFALAGELGVAAAHGWPGVFFDPSYVAGDGLLSAVIGSGSSVMARAIASGLSGLALLAIGVALVGRAVRDSHARSISGLGLPRLSLLIVGAVVQLEVVARVLRTAGSIRDLETLGVLPFVFHELLQFHREQYDLALFQLSRLLDPIFSEVVLIGLYGLIAAAWLTWRALARARRQGPRSLLRRPRLRLTLRVPAGPRRVQMAVEASLVVVLLATSPIGQAVQIQTRYLEMEGSIGSSADLNLPSSPDALAPVPLGEPVAPASAQLLPPSGLPVVQVGPLPQVAVAPSGSPVAAVPAAPAVGLSPPPAAGPSVVGIGGRGYRFTYVVNGTVTEFRGMGYNVTHAGLPAPERAERLRRDFQLMRESGVNTVVGWRTPEWDEAVLDAAQAAGIGVVMPYDLDDKLDFSDRTLRWRIRSDVLAWVARYRSHPAIRMWGLGNETLLHMKQAARSRAFADFYTELVDRVRQFDRDHPVLYREAEDLYVRPLQEVWAQRGGPPQGFVLGMNFYTFRMRDGLDGWPKRAMDVPLIVSEFAPAGIGRGERAAGYWRMWAMIRARPDYVLGAAPYVWSVEGPEPVDRLFGLTEGGKAVDSALGTLRDMYSLPLPAEAGPDVAAPALLGLRLADARRVI